MMYTVENALRQLESKRTPSEKHSFLVHLSEENNRVFRKIVNNNLGDHLIYVSESHVHVSSGDLSKMDKLEQRFTDSIIGGGLLSPQIAVINNYKVLADKLVVRLHSHLKTAGINIGNALPIHVDLKNIDEVDKVVRLLTELYPKLHILYVDKNDSIVTFLSSDRNIFDDVFESFEKCYPDTNPKTLKKLIWSKEGDSYHLHSDGHRHGSSLKQVIEYIKTVPGKPFSLSAVSDDNSVYRELIELDGRWIKKIKPEDKLDVDIKKITITRIEITEQHKKLVIDKLKENAITNDVYEIEKSQIDGSLPLYTIIKQLKLEISKTFKGSIESLTGESVGSNLQIWETAFVMVYLETVFDDYKVWKHAYERAKNVYEKAKNWIDGKFGLKFDQLKDTCMEYLIEVGIKFYEKPMFIHTFKINDDNMELVYSKLKNQSDLNTLLKSVSENVNIDYVTSGNFNITFDDKTIEALKYYIDVLGARRFEEDVLVSFFAIVFLDTFIDDDNISKSKRESAWERIQSKVQNLKLEESITRGCEQYLRKRVYDYYTENDMMIDVI